MISTSKMVKVHITQPSKRFNLQRDSRAVLLSKVIHVQKTVKIRLLQIAVQHLLADLHHPLHVVLSHGGHMFQVGDGEESIVLSPSIKVVLGLPLTLTSLQADKQALRNIFTCNIKIFFNNLINGEGDLLETPLHLNISSISLPEMVRTSSRDSSRLSRFIISFILSL